MILQITLLRKEYKFSDGFQMDSNREFFIRVKSVAFECQEQMMRRLRVDFQGYKNLSEIFSHLNFKAEQVAEISADERNQFYIPIERINGMLIFEDCNLFTKIFGSPLKCLNDE